MPDPRNKVVFTAMAALVAALVVGLTVSLWQAVRARNAGQAAREIAALAVAERNTAVEARRAADQERERADRQRADAERHLYVVPGKQRSLRGWALGFVLMRAIECWGGD